MKGYHIILGMTGIGGAWILYKKAQDKKKTNLFTSIVLGDAGAYDGLNGAGRQTTKLGDSVHVGANAINAKYFDGYKNMMPLTTIYGNANPPANSGLGIRDTTAWAAPSDNQSTPWVVGVNGGDAMSIMGGWTESKDEYAAVVANGWLQQGALDAGGNNQSDNNPRTPNGKPSVGPVTVPARWRSYGSYEGPYPEQPTTSDKVGFFGGKGLR